MPQAIIPIALAAASAIGSNVQQKAANKNNLNQQQGAVDNSRASYAQAMQQMQQLIAQNPGPFAGQSILGPTGNYGGPPGAAPHPSLAGQVLNPGSGATGTPPGDGNIPLHLPHQPVGGAGLGHGLGGHILPSHYPTRYPHSILPY